MEPPNFQKKKKKTLWNSRRLWHSSGSDSVTASTIKVLGAVGLIICPRMPRWQGVSDSNVNSGVDLSSISCMRYGHLDILIFNVCYDNHQMNSCGNSQPPPNL